MSGFRIWMMLLACLVQFASGRHRRWLARARSARSMPLPELRGAERRLSPVRIRVR
jgi:hypothetical protein